MILRIASVLLLLASAACVETDPEMGSAAEPLTSYCVEPVAAVAPAPQSSPFFFILPADMPEQNWVLVQNPVQNNAPPSYMLLQVSAKTRTVGWRSTVPAAYKPFALALVATRTGVQVSIRNPPPPPFPPGDDWDLAHFAVAIAGHMDATSSIPWHQGQ